MTMTNNQYGEWAFSEGVDPYGPRHPADPTPATNSVYSTIQHLAMAFERISPDRVATRHLPTTYAAGRTDPVPLALQLCATGDRKDAYRVIEVVNSALTATCGLCEEIDIDTEFRDPTWHARLDRQVRHFLDEETVDRLTHLGSTLVADAGHGSGYWMHAAEFTAAIIGFAAGDRIPPQLREDLIATWRDAVKAVADMHLAALRSRRAEQSGRSVADPVEDRVPGHLRTTA